MSYTTHVKGFDSFYTSVYETGEKWLKNALEEAGYEVEFMPNHIAAEKFPYTVEELREYDCVILSDIGANTLLLPAETFTKSIKKPDRAKVIRDYVLEGGALLMGGGYLNPGNSGFTGILNDHYIDKTGLIALINDTIETPRRLTCISRFWT